MSVRKRPYTTNDPHVGEVRCQAIKDAIDRYNQAHDAGFFVECVALVEGLIGDRMESLANQIDGNEDKSYKPLGPTRQRLVKVQDSLPQSIMDLLPLIKEWADKRNAAIHELPKVQPDLNITFGDRYAEVENTAVEGFELFRKLDNEIRIFRRNLKKTKQQ